MSLSRGSLKYNSYCVIIDPVLYVAIKLKDEVFTAGTIESVHMSIAVPAPLPGPTTVNVVNGDAFDILKIPFPVP
jgi:hypothetical protein